MRKLAAAPLLAVLVLVGCSQPMATPAPPEASTEAPVTVERTEVDWDAYPPSTQQLIDEAEAAQDCDALQEMFEVADNAGFLDQMQYIDEALKLAGCYG